MSGPVTLASPRARLALTAAGCGVVAVIGLLEPSRIGVALPCPLRVTTGLDCPLCGATRATTQLLRGNISAALDFNALYVVLLPALFVAGLVWLARGRWPSVILAKWFPAAAIAVAVAYMIVRNLPWAPFSYLGT